MVLALLQRLREQQATPPTLLLDDPAAELDAERLASLVQMVTELECQLVITSLDPDLQIFGRPERVFHVEQGVVTPALSAGQSAGLTAERSGVIIIRCSHKVPGCPPKIAIIPVISRC